MALLLAVAVVACRKEEQAVVGVAHSPQQAEQKAQAAATERDRQRAANWPRSLCPPRVSTSMSTNPASGPIPSSAPMPTT